MLVLETVDGFFQVGAPVLYVTDIVMLAALALPAAAPSAETQVRYISLFTDYFALFLLLGIAISGVWMRYFAGWTLWPSSSSRWAW